MILLTNIGFAQSPTRVDIHQALKLTEKYVEKNKIDVSEKFISKAELHLSDDDNPKPYWTITYKTGFQYRGGEIIFKITNESLVSHVNTM